MNDYRIEFIWFIVPSDIRRGVKYVSGENVEDAIVRLVNLYEKDLKKIAHITSLTKL